MEKYSDKYIVITRPEARGNQLKAYLSKLNYHIIDIPCLQITNLNIDKFNIYNNIQLEDLKVNIQNIDILIFVSTNAVNSFFNLIDFNLINSANKLVAVGKKTAECLVKHGFINIEYPESEYQQSSEYLVKLASLTDNISNKSVLLVRGDTSREYISRVLTQRQVNLSEVITYNTAVPHNLKLDINQKLEKLKSIAIENILIVITSVSILNNFYNNLTKDLLDKLLGCKLLVASDRIASFANQYGFANIIVTNTMDDDSIKDIIEYNNR